MAEEVGDKDTDSYDTQEEDREEVLVDYTEEVDQRVAEVFRTWEVEGADYTQQLVSPKEEAVADSKQVEGEVVSVERVDVLYPIETPWLWK